MLFYFYFGQQEAGETIIYLFEYKKFKDITEVINEYSHLELDLGPGRNFNELSLIPPSLKSK